MRTRSLVLFAFTAALLAGCVSTEEQFSEAQSLRSSGQYEEAAYLLVRVLERDDAYPGARRTLATVGRQAMDSLMTVARAAHDADAPIRAVTRLDAINALYAACADVDVSLQLPNGYAALRQTAEQRAFASVMTDARSATQARDWTAADELYTRALRYTQSQEQRRTVDEARADLHLQWSNARMAAGAFRDAYERAGFVLSEMPPTHSLAQEAEALRAEALDRGTRHLACVPLEQTRSAERSLSTDFLADLNDLLRYEYWSAPPPFVATADPSQTWRALRRLDVGGGALDRRDATTLGREVDADYVFVGTLTQLTPSQENMETDLRQAPLLNQEGDTTYTVRRYDLLLTATVDVALFDARSGDTVHEATLTIEAEAPVERATYNGDWETLALAREERRLFSRRAYDRIRADVEGELQERIAASVSETAYGVVLDRIE